MHTNLLAVSVNDIGSRLAGGDWGIVAAFLVITTIVAFLVKGRQAGLRDFFLGDRSLPWIVVCGSLIATEISAASFVGVPHAAYTGSLVYLQLAIGAIIARFIIGYHFVPGFYEGEYYSPYQYVGNKLGLGAEKMTSTLFVIGAILGQGARVFFVAAVLQLITHIHMSWCIVVIVAFAALWAFIGGIRTVVWTDLVQFFVIVVAAIVAAVFLITHTEGGLSYILNQAKEMQKLQVLDVRFDLLVPFTIWAGLFGATFNTLASHGADQMNAQRLFCCRGPAQAKRAILWSSLSQVVVLLLALIGLGLFGFFGAHPERFPEAARRIISQGGQGDWEFPIFVAAALPAGLKGLLVIGLLAAAISSLSSALSALAQTSARAFFEERKATVVTDERSKVHWSRLFILFWGVALGVMAMCFQALVEFGGLLNMAQGLTSFTYGALAGVLILAFHPAKRDGRGILFSAPFAVFAAFGAAVHSAWSHWVVIAGVGVLFVAWFYVLMQETEQLNTVRDHNQFVRRAWYILLAEVPRTIWVLAGCLLVLYLHFYATVVETGTETAQPQYLELAWPWYLPMGAGITIVLGYLLSRPLPQAVTEK